MYITYQDKLGLVCMEVDFCGITFCDGKCYFTSDDKDYIIPIASIVRITEGSAF